jgi:ubiquitin C-terminal hydrolase
MSYSSEDSESSAAAYCDPRLTDQDNLDDELSVMPLEADEVHESTFPRTADAYGDVLNGINELPYTTGHLGSHSVPTPKAELNSDESTPTSFILLPYTADHLGVHAAPTPQAELTSDESTPTGFTSTAFSAPAIPDIALSIKQNCGKIDGYVTEKHCLDTFQCCSHIMNSLYILNLNAEIVDGDPLTYFERLVDPHRIPFLAFPHIDLNHEVQLLDRFSRLCHAEIYNDYGNHQRKCVQNISRVISARLVSLLQEYELVTRCVDTDSPFLSGSLASGPPIDVMPSLRSRSSSPVPMPSQNLGAKRCVTFVDNRNDRSSFHAGRTSPVLQSAAASFPKDHLNPVAASAAEDDFPDRCCALLWGLKHDESDKLHPFRTCRCSNPVLPHGRLCERHSRVPKLELLGTVPLDSFDLLDQHRSRMDALKIIFPSPLSSSDTNLYLKSVLKRLSMMIDRCRAMLTCSQRFLKSFQKSFSQFEINAHQSICESFSIVGKFAPSLIFRIASQVPDSLSFISGEHGCALSFIADPCKTFFLNGLCESDHGYLNAIFASICDFTVVSCHNLVDHIRSTSATSMAAQAIFQSLDKLASFIKSACLLWSEFHLKCPLLSFPFGLLSSSTFLSSLLLYSPFSLPRVLSSLDLLHSIATLMNGCSRDSSTCLLSVEFGRFIVSIQKHKFTSSEECESALLLFDSFLKTVNSTTECQVVQGACPTSVAATLFSSIFSFLNEFQMQNESAAGICALLRNAKCWSRREEACRILVIFLASSHELFNMDSVLSILPWDNRYDEDWVEVESVAIGSMVHAAKARPSQQLQRVFLENSMKRILSCARITADNRRSMCEVAIGLLKVLACDEFPSTMFRNVLVQVDQELFSACSPPNHDGMKLFLQIVDIIVNKFPDLIQEVTERWILIMKESHSRFSIASSAILLSSILRLRSENVDEKLFSVDFVIPKFSQLLSDSNDDAFFKLEDCIVHMLTLCRNIYAVQSSIPTANHITQLQTILSTMSANVRDALYDTILSPALFYLNLTKGMMQRATPDFTSTQMSLKSAFDFLLKFESDRTIYLRKFITEFCSNAVSVLQTPLSEAATSVEFSNLFKLQLCSWPNSVSDSKVPRQPEAIHHACQAGLLCLSTIIHPNCPVFFGRVPQERKITVYSGDYAPTPNAMNYVAPPNVHLKLKFNSSSVFLHQYRFDTEALLPLIPGRTKCVEYRATHSMYHSLRVFTDSEYLGPYHFRAYADYVQFQSEISNALIFCESLQQFQDASAADLQPSNISESTSGTDFFSVLIGHAKSDPIVIRFLSIMFASIFSSHNFQKPLVQDALSKYSHLLGGDEREIEMTFLIIRQALHLFPSTESLGFSCLLSNPYVQETITYGSGINYTPPLCKIFHASQIFKTVSEYPNYTVEYHADVSGETFFSCVDLVPETGMPKVIALPSFNRDTTLSCTQLTDASFKRAEKLKPTHHSFRHMMAPLSGTEFGKQLLECALKIVSVSWSSGSDSCSNYEVFDLAADILALLPASRSLDGIGKISSSAEALMHCDICDMVNDIERCIDDENVLAPAVQSIGIFERAVFRSKQSDSWPLRKFSYTVSSPNPVDRAAKVIPRFILKCVECIGRQTVVQSKFLLSGVSTALRSLVAISQYVDFRGTIKHVLMGVQSIFSNRQCPTVIQVPITNSYPSSGYIRHDIICNFMDCVSLYLRSNPETIFGDLLDLVGPLIKADVFPKNDDHHEFKSAVPFDASKDVTVRASSLWLTSEEMFTLCSRLAHLSDQYPLSVYAVSQNTSIQQCSFVFAAMMQLCSEAGVGCTNRTAAVTGLLAKIILQCASTTAGHASTLSSARLALRAKDVLDQCRLHDATKHVIPLLVDTVMNSFCSISLDQDFLESTLGECFEIFRVVLYIIQDQRERSPSSSGLSQSFQEENVLKSFQKSLDVLTALFDSKTSRGSMISTKVCELLLKVIASFDDLLSPRMFVEKLFFIHEIAEKRRYQLALPVKNVVVTIHDAKKHSMERTTDPQVCSSCNVEVKWADMCTRCLKCQNCSSSEPQCTRLRQAHGWSGLTNIGNTCFMNAVLQQLAAIPWVVNSVLFAKPKHFSEPSESVDVLAAPSTSPQVSPSLLVEFQKLVAEMLYSNSGVVGTREFAGASKFEGEPLIVGQQQDAGSYFRSFIDQIEGDLSDIKRQEWRNLFNGSIQTQTIRKCHADDEGLFITTKSEDVFGEILLSVTGKKNLQECIAARLSAGERQVHCEHCGKTSTASTQDSFLKLPPILICQFHRASADGSKCLDRPSFPYQSTLDLSPYMSPDSTQQSCLYELQGIVLHKGESVRSGHYISIIRERATHPCSRLGGTVDKDPQWWMMNDETVSAVTRESLHELCSFEGLPCSDVHEALPYLLVFTRKHTRGPSAPRSFSSALTRQPAGLRDSALPFDIYDSETPGAETPGSSSALSQVSDGTPTTERAGISRRKSEGTGAYVKGENFVARLDTVLQHSDGRVPLLSDGSQFVFQNILKRHDARVQSVLLCHSYSNLIERMLKRLHEKAVSKVTQSSDLKAGDLVVLDASSHSSDRSHDETYEVVRSTSASGYSFLCRPLSGGHDIELGYWELKKPAPMEDVRAV